MITVPMAITSVCRGCRWVAVLTLALGLVVMHHLVGTHTHPEGFQDSPTQMTMLAPPIHNDGIAAAKATAAPAGPGTDGGLMLHLCQAVLTGLVLLTGLSLASWLAPASELGPPGSGSG